MSPPRQCPQCGAELAPDAPGGLCPACLMKAGLDSQHPTADSPAAPQGSPATGAFIPPSPADLAPRFPNLEILELLGQGGMGAVYKARQPDLDRLVALKILPPGIGQDPAFAERFKREARSLGRLNHPNIVAVYDFGQAAGQYYFLMEYVDGVSLRQLERAERPSPKQALGIVMQICEALQFAHDEGIVHRDIKPENILIDKKGRVKIADFGLAKLLGRTPADFTLTQPQQVMGTVHYMAPEQLEHPAEVDQRADIYSLGVVFYEMLTGELPLGRFAPPSKKVEIDVRLDEVVLKTLEKEPERRYQHASEVKTDVEEISRAPQAPAAPALAAQVPDVVLRQRWTGITMAFIMLAQVAFLMLQASASVMKARCFVVLAAMGGASLAWWWYLLAKSPDRPRSFADFFRTMLGPHSRAKRLALPLGIFLGACAVAAIAVSAMDVGDAAITVVIAIPLVIGPYLLMAVLWRIYRPAAGWVRSQAKPVAGGPAQAVPPATPETPQPPPEQPGSAQGDLPPQSAAQPAAPASAQPAPEVAAPPARATDARRWWFMVPAVGLLVTGILDCLSMPLIAFALTAVLYAGWGPTFRRMNPAVILIALGVLVLGLGMGVLIIVGSIKMMRLRSSALARTSAVLAMSPFPNPVTWLLGLPMGIWALVVLSRPEVEAAFAATAKPPVPADRVRRPAIGLIVAAVINAMIYFLVQMMGLRDTLRVGEPAGLIAVSVGAILVSLLIILAAWRMMSLRSYGLAVAGSILALIPLGPGWLIGLPFGIWALAVLTRPDVKAAFGAAKGRSAGGPAATQEAASKEPPPPEQPGSAHDGLPAQAAAQRPGKGRRTRPAWLVAVAIVGALVLLLAVLVVGGYVAWRLARSPGSSTTPAMPWERKGTEDGPEVTTFYWGHYSGQGSSNPEWERVITKTGVEVDRAIASRNSGEGSLKVVADGPTVVRLFEHGPTAYLYTVGPVDVDNSRLTYQAKLRTWGLQGRAYLEMRCHFPGGEESVSRGLDRSVSGTHDWTSVETSFVVEGAREPDNVQLNLVIDGKGTVWIDDVGLTLRPPSAKRGG